jgi:trehalose 6-phosphate phosphatase
MRYLFSREGLKSIQPYLSEDTLLVFDFDGTLAPIVKQHHRAALPKTTLDLLKQLSRLAPIALLSGRSVKDLKSRSPLPALAWIGNHGMEGLPGEQKQARKTLMAVKGWGRALIPQLESEPELSLENKLYSITLHYRASKSPARAEKRLRSLAAALRPRPEVQAGKCVLNLFLPGHTNKGEAVQKLLKRYRFGKAVFVGDDETDEDVFRLRDPRIFSVRVGIKKGSSANAYLRNQKETNALLRLLLKRH